MPYYSLGYPTPSQSVEIIEAIAQAGVDLMELGLPFSDPLADGPTIQHSMQIALNHGITIRDCFELVRTIRKRGIQQPILLMGYFNPILAYGLEEFIAEAAAVEAEGLIIPDLPIEESHPVEQLCRQQRLAMVYLLPPTVEEERAKKIASRSSGFVYLVSLTGVTGARQKLPSNLQAFVQKARSYTELPLAVGFGISTPEHVKDVGKFADGVIIGSALINAVEQASDPAKAAREYISTLKNACQRIA